MSALVVYESMFGNTQSIAKAIADGLSSRMCVEVVEVGDAPRVIGADVELLMVGGPTHAFGMSRPGTRQSAAQQAGHDLVSKGIGMREWLVNVRGESKSVAATAFDTRINKPRVPGSAARAVQKRLSRLGFRIVAPAESFWVTGTPGPLLDGELERASRWGEKLGLILTATRPGGRVS
jgi:hypothetical protein